MTASKAGETPGTRSQNTTHDNVTCPFCGILCDDLQIASSQGALKVLRNGCEKAVAGFERQVSGAKAMINGREASLDDALTAARDLIAKSSLPLFGGLGTDVDGIRAVIALAERAGGVVDHALSEGQYRNFRVLQTSGWFMSTLTETRNRADLIVVVGSDLHKLHPRFFERVVNADTSLLSETPPKRTVVFIGKGLDTSGATGPRIGEVITLPCPLEEVTDVISALRAVMKGAPLHTDEIAGIKVSDIVSLADRCRKASYGVMVWAPPSLAFPHAELTVQLISELVKEINETSRFACLSLGGNEGAVSAGAVCSWQSGYPLRVSFQSGKPDYDPLRYAIGRMLSQGEGDLLVWISSFTPDLPPPEAKIPTIVFGTPGLKLSAQPAVFIPIGTPGADHAGRIVRCDNVVTLPLRDLGRASLPKLSDLLARIELSL
jgi:formylmethanofuran dehydrogenase subunit B